MTRLFCVLALSFLILPALFAQETATPHGKISGLAFGDYFYNISRDSAINRLSNTATGGDKSFQAFQLRRMYFTYDNDISDQFTARFRIDADQSALASDGKISMYLRDAFLRWKNIYRGGDLIIGMQPTPAFEISENFWSYRSLDKTIMDLRGIVSSRDLSVALRGRLDDAGTVNYWAMIGNNSANKPETDKYKRFYLTLWFKPTSELQATIYGDYKDQAKVNDPSSTLIPKATLSHGSLTGGAFIGYGPAEFHVGVEGFLQSTAHDFTEAGGTGPIARTAMGISVFGWYNVQTDVSLVGRYDYFDPNTNSASKGDARNYFLGGVAWSPNKNVSIIPNVQVETYESLPGGQTFEPSVTGRATFYYVFL